MVSSPLLMHYLSAVLPNLCSVCLLLHLHLQSWPDLKEKLGVLTTPNALSVCCTPKPLLCVLVTTFTFAVLARPEGEAWRPHHSKRIICPLYFQTTVLCSRPQMKYSGTRAMLSPILELS